MMWQIGIDLHRRMLVMAAVKDDGEVIEATGTYRWLYDLFSPHGTATVAPPTGLGPVVYWFGDYTALLQQHAPPGLPRWLIGLATIRCHRVAQSNLPGLSAAGGAERLGRVAGQAGSPRPVVVFKPINHRHRVGGEKTPCSAVRPTQHPVRSCIDTMVRAAHPA